VSRCWLKRETLGREIRIKNEKNGSCMSILLGL
jgi:hypothetical protein